MSGCVALRMAYAVTLIIELLYVHYLLVRFRKVRRERNDLKKHSSRRPRERKTRRPRTRRRRQLHLFHSLRHHRLPFFWRLWEVLPNWPETDAQVIRSEVVAQALGHDNFYRAKLHMIYTFGGRPVVAELTSFESKNYEATFERTEQFPLASHHPIRYHPANPSQARAGRGWNRTFFDLRIIVGVTVLSRRCSSSRRSGVAGHC